MEESSVEEAAVGKVEVEEEAKEDGDTLSWARLCRCN